MIQRLKKLMFAILLICSIIFIVIMMYCVAILLAEIPHVYVFCGLVLLLLIDLVIWVITGKSFWINSLILDKM